MAANDINFNAFFTFDMVLWIKIEVTDNYIHLIFQVNIRSGNYVHLANIYSLLWPYS